MIGNRGEDVKLRSLLVLALVMGVVYGCGSPMSTPALWKCPGTITKVYSFFSPGDAANVVYEHNGKYYESYVTAALPPHLHVGEKVTVYAVNDSVSAIVPRLR